MFSAKTKPSWLATFASCTLALIISDDFLQLALMVFGRSISHIAAAHTVFNLCNHFDVAMYVIFCNILQNTHIQLTFTNPKSLTSYYMYVLIFKVPPTTFSVIYYN